MKPVFAAKSKCDSRRQGEHQVQVHSIGYKILRSSEVGRDGETLGPGLPTVAQKALAWYSKRSGYARALRTLQTPKPWTALPIPLLLVITALVKEYLRNCSAFICIFEACACGPFSAIFCAKCLGCLIEFSLVPWRNRLTSTL